MEKQYDMLLRGTDGARFRTVDVREKYLKGKPEEDIPPEPGKNLVLTIDRRIQLLCEKALGERIGSVVVLKPSTGEILAMVSYPYYDAKTHGVNFAGSVVPSLKSETLPKES